jgi:hypothetical protein
VDIRAGTGSGVSDEVIGTADRSTCLRQLAANIIMAANSSAALIDFFILASPVINWSLFAMARRQIIRTGKSAVY